VTEAAAQDQSTGTGVGDRARGHGQRVLGGRPVERAE
jgi:hypothetical protein